MMRDFILTISVFSFLMLNIASMLYCYDGIGDSVTQIEKVDILDSASMDIVSDCHSSGACHVAAHALSSNIDEHGLFKVSSGYDLSKEKNIFLQPQYPPFQPPRA